MNVFAGSGRIIKVSETILTNNGKIRILKFSIAVKNKNPDFENEKTDIVPCILYNPNEDLEKWLISKGQGSYIEFQGKVITFTFEISGETVQKTEIVVNPRTINIVPCQ